MSNDVIGELKKFIEEKPGQAKEIYRLVLNIPELSGFIKDKIRFENLMHLLANLEKKDTYTMRHCQAVAQYSKRIAESLDEFSTMDCELIYYAALFHDIGKSTWDTEDDDFIFQPIMMSKKDKARIMQHPERAQVVLEANFDVDFPFKKKIIECIEQHHENYDGTGYPNGMEGKRISSYARVIRIADSFDAATTDRPYKNGISKEMAVVDIMQKRRVHYDPEYVKAFISIAYQTD